MSFFIDYNLRSWKKVIFWRNIIYLINQFNYTSSVNSLMFKNLIFHSCFSFFLQVTIFKHSKLNTDSWANNSWKFFKFIFYMTSIWFTHRMPVFRIKMYCLKDWWHFEDSNQDFPIPLKSKFRSHCGQWCFTFSFAPLECIKMIKIIL